MTRSHPPTLLRLVRRTLVEECEVGSGDRILVAVSGGPDSSALLHALSRIAPELGFSLSAHGIDHGLRAEADGELDVAERLAARCGVPFGRTKVQVAKGGNVQARARAVRREALERAADAAGARWIATAHHQEDRAETVLIRLLAGASPQALAVLPPQDGRWIRPLTHAARTDILAHLRRHEIPFAEDPSNRDPRFLRVRVRMEVLPRLRELSPAIDRHLSQLAEDCGALVADEPRITEDSGDSVRLKRSHAAAIRRAIRLGRPARIRLPGDRELEVEPKTGRVDVFPAAPLARGTRAKRGKPVKRPARHDKGGAKRGKSG